MQNKSTKNTIISPKRIILGIDPGTNVMGFGVLLIDGNKMLLLELGVFNLKKLETQQDKLQQIFYDVIAVIQKHKPTELAIEAPFFGKNVQSMLKLGRAQGVVMAAALSENLQITEYSPRKIKQSITGNGNASKEQVSAMLHSLLSMKENSKLLDATDALAVAVCHFFQRGSASGSKKNYSGWGSFVKQNPSRKITKRS